MALRRRLVAFASMLAALAGPASAAPAPAQLPPCLAAALSRCEAIPPREIPTARGGLRVIEARCPQRSRHLIDACTAADGVSHTTADGIETLRFAPGGAEPVPTVARLSAGAEGGLEVVVTTPASPRPELPPWVPRCVGCRVVEQLVEGDRILAVLSSEGGPAYLRGRLDTAFAVAGWSPAAALDPRYPADRYARRYTRGGAWCLVRIERSPEPHTSRFAMTCRHAQ